MDRGAISWTIICLPRLNQHSSGGCPPVTSEHFGGSICNPSIQLDTNHWLNAPFYYHAHINVCTPLSTADIDCCITIMTACCCLHTLPQAVQQESEARLAALTHQVESLTTALEAAITATTHADAVTATMQGLLHEAVGLVSEAGAVMAEEKVHGANNEAGPDASQLEEVVSQLRAELAEAAVASSLLQAEVNRLQAAVMEATTAAALPAADPAVTDAEQEAAVAAAVTEAVTAAEALHAAQVAELQGSMDVLRSQLAEAVTRSEEAGRRCEEVEMQSEKRLREAADKADWRVQELEAEVAEVKEVGGQNPLSKPASHIT